MAGPVRDVCLGVAGLLGLFARDPVLAARTELLSLAGLPVAAGEYVSGFELQTWTVDVLAVCRFPIGWTITAGTYGDPGGVLSGTANIGAAFIGQTKLQALGSLFLVQVGQYRPRAIEGPGGSHTPATFAGTATIGRYGPETVERKVNLSGLNVRRVLAARCPKPGH